MDVRERIRRTVAGEPMVAFARLFGSRAEGGAARPSSDWDVAVYLDESLTPDERFALRRRLGGMLSGPSGPEVDVVVLNDAPPLLAHRALQGDELVTRDRSAYVRFFVRTMGASEDERYFRATHTRARGVSRRDALVDREVFDRRLARLEELLRELRRVASLDESRLRSDRGLQAQAERWTHLAVECCLGLANHLIADRGQRAPDSYRAAFLVLSEEGVLDAELAEQMAAWAGLRNILVHLYLDVDHQRLHAILRTELDQLAAFARAMQRELERR